MKQRRIKRYRCGHAPSVVILDDNPLCFSIWAMWNDEGSGLCLNCWSKKHGFLKKKE
jgi:hypothetical protein